MRSATIGSIILSIAVSFAACSGHGRMTGSVDSSALLRAIDSRSSNMLVEGEGTVSRVLADDREGSPHQRFIVRLSDGRTVLISHNIDLAPRVEGIREGDSVSFSGEYEWNERGGVVHWTHRDPAGRHADGWIKHNGRTYQ